MIRILGHERGKRIVVLGTFAEGPPLNSHATSESARPVVNITDNTSISSSTSSSISSVIGEQKTELKLAIVIVEKHDINEALLPYIWGKDTRLTKLDQGNDKYHQYTYERPSVIRLHYIVFQRRRVHSAVLAPSLSLAKVDVIWPANEWDIAKNTLASRHFVFRETADIYHAVTKPYIMRYYNTPPYPHML
jgi:hypothetical protein